MNNREYGTLGEKEAMNFLADKGYQIVGANFRAGRLGEIDIIAKKGETLCFIEVKTRSNDRFGTPAQAVSFTKQANITRLAQIYLQRHRIGDVPLRFDVIEIKMDRLGRTQQVNLIENAF